MIWIVFLKWKPTYKLITKQTVLGLTRNTCGQGIAKRSVHNDVINDFVVSKSGIFGKTAKILIEQV